jgi:hypothetical protein
MAELSEERRAYIWQQRDDLRYRARLSAAYHSKRERFFTLNERLFQAFTAITATAAFSDLVGRDGPYAKWFAFFAALFSIIPLVFNFSGKGNEHAVLAGEHRRLLAEIAGCGLECSEAQLVALQVRFAQVEVAERASLGALVVACQNEMAAMEGKASYPLNLRERLFMHFVHFDPAKISARPKC